MNIHTVVGPKFQILFEFPVFPLASFFSSRTQFSIPHCIQSSLLLSLQCDNFSVFPCFVSLVFVLFVFCLSFLINQTSFEEYQSGILQNIPQFGFFFLLIIVGGGVLEENTAKVKGPSHHMISAGDHNLDHLVKAVCQMCPL